MIPGKPLSGWTNLQDVFAANKGNGAQMNDQVYKPLENAGQTALDQLGKAHTGFQQAAQRGAGQPTGIQYQAAPGPTYSTKPNTSNDPYRIGGPANADTENERNRLAADQSQNNAQLAAKSYADAQAATAQAVTQSTASYQGPRTLKEYDPNVGNQVGDAAARINASPGAQFQAQFTGANAQGGALDRAMMGAEGGGDRAEALQGKFGGLMAQLRAEQDQAAKYGTGQADAVSERAAAAAGSLPGLRAAEDAAKRSSEDTATVAKNNAERAAYDKAWAAANTKLRARRGNQIQRTYSPPESAMLPVYPAS